MQTANEILNDLVNNNPTGHKFTVETLRNMFTTEITQFESNEISEEELYETICTEVDRGNVK